MVDQILTYFDSFIPLKEVEKQALTSRLSLRKVKRKQSLLMQGDICHHYIFVAKGCLRLYAVDKNGKEYNLQFATENEWIFDLDSLHHEKPSNLNIDTLEASEIFLLAKQDLWYLYTNYPVFDRSFRVSIEDRYIELQNRLIQNLSDAAADRYDAFLQRYPSLALRLPNTMIASYLGITPEFLSKIRASY